MFLCEGDVKDHYNDQPGGHRETISDTNTMHVGVQNDLGGRKRRLFCLT